MTTLYDFLIHNRVDAPLVEALADRMLHYDKTQHLEWVVLSGSEAHAAKVQNRWTAHHQLRPDAVGGVAEGVLIVPAGYTKATWDAAWAAKHGYYLALAVQALSALEACGPTNAQRMVYYETSKADNVHALWRGMINVEIHRGKQLLEAYTQKEKANAQDLG